MKRTAPKIKIFAAVLFALCFLSGMTVAATPEAYKTKVDRAAKFARAVETLIRADDTVDVKLLTDEIRRDFPSTERIEWEGGVAETSNDWLLEKARVLDLEHDPKKQLPAIVEVCEYLSAISFKLDELNVAI